MFVAKNPLKIMNWASFLQTQIYMLPILLLFYQANGLTTGDFFLFQGIFSICALIFEIPAGYIGDIFPRKNILILSYSLFLTRLVIWFFFAQYGYWPILMGEVLYAASKSFFSGISDGYIYDYLKSIGKTKKMLKQYGHFNFYMSVGTAVASLLGAYLYGTISVWSKEKFGVDYGFLTLIVIEMIFNTSSIMMLLFLPNVPSAKRKIPSISEKYKDLYQIAKKTFASEKLSSYVVFSGLLAGTTMIFVWSFQPLMKAVGIPVTLFGVVYFINHFIRATAGYFLHKIVAFFTLKRLGEITYVLFFAAFGVAFLMTKLNHPPLWVSFAILTFICIVIGFQLSFTLGSVSRIHSIVTSDIRATVSSLNTMFSRLMSGFFLILFKFLLDGTIGSSYFIYIAILCFGAIPLLKLLRIQDRTNESEATNNQPS